MSSIKKTITIGDKKLYYEEVELYHGRKKINKKNASENLLILHPILEKSKVRYGLFFGTLLGAIRENDIIEHDEDIDIYLLAEDKSLFLKYFFEINDAGLKLIRYTSDLISFMRKDEYIDIYLFKQKKYLFFPNIRILGNRHKVKACYLEHSIIYNFLGKDFKIPNNPETVLMELYGANWRTPIKNYPAPPNTLHSKIRGITPIFLLNALNSLNDFFNWMNLRISKMYARILWQII